MSCYLKTENMYFNTCTKRLHTCRGGNEICRDKGSKSIYWAVGLVWGRIVVRGQINDSEDVRIRTPQASYY